MSIRTETSEAQTSPESKEQELVLKLNQRLDDQTLTSPDNRPEAVVMETDQRSASWTSALVTMATHALKPFN